MSPLNIFMEYSAVARIGMAIGVYSIATGFLYLAVCAWIYRLVEPELKRRGQSLTFEEVADYAKRDRYVKLLPQDVKLKKLTLVARVLYYSGVVALMVAVSSVFVSRTLGF